MVLLDTFGAVEVKFLEDAHDVVLQHVQAEDLHANIEDDLVLVVLQLLDRQ